MTPIESLPHSAPVSSASSEPNPMFWIAVGCLFGLTVDVVLLLGEKTAQILRSIQDRQVVHWG